MSLDKLIEKSKEYSLPQKFIDEQEQGRLLFISKFPLDEITNLNINQYASGTDENSFCYWLEFKKILFGIGGGNASKFGFYKAKDEKYYKGFGKFKEQIAGDELANYFEDIKNGIISALTLTDKNEVNKIKELKVPLWNFVLQKILSIYYPEKFITVGAPDVLIECARDIKLKDIELNTENSILINYECKKKFDSLSHFKDWHYVKIGSFIWENYHEEAKRNYYIIGSKYGDKADEDVFPEMLKRSIIATGFASKINLEEYYGQNHSEITQFLKEKGEDSKSYNALKYFLNLYEGDRIAIKADGSPKGKKGFLSIVGIAEVVEKDGEVYKYEPNGLGHLINVKYIKAPVYKEFDLGGYGRTIHKLSNPEHIELIFKSEYDNGLVENLNDIPQEVKVIYAYLKESFSHRKIQREILNKEAPAHGGGFLAMDILHKYEIEGDKKGILNRVPFNEEFKISQGKYREALEILKKHYPEFTENRGEINMNLALNTIFYGPPGTGKTYTTILRAAQIIENKAISDYSEALRIFNQHLGDRIEFITFHQNYSYEDFIQGLRPDVDSDSELSFERKDGVFKIIADRALNNLLLSEKDPEEVSKEFLLKRVFKIS